MSLSKSTVTATLALLFIGGLSIAPASAAQHWSDISSVTHGETTTETAQQQYGRFSDFYKWSDKASLSTRRVGTTIQPMGQSDNKSAKWSDLTAITHN